MANLLNMPAVTRAPRDLWAKTLLSLALAALFIWLMARGGVPLVPSGAALANVRWWVVPIYVVSWLASHWFRASRWAYLIAPVCRLNLAEVIRICWVGFFAIFALPLRIGEIVRPVLLKMRHDVRLSAGLGTVAVERVIDGIITSLCVVWALFFLPRQTSSDPIAQSLPYYGYLTLAVFIGAFSMLALFLYQRELAVKLLQRTVGLVSARAGAFIAVKLASLADGLESISKPRLLLPFLGESLLYWLLNALGMWLLAWACGLPLHFGHAIGLMGILAIGVLLPAGPGLFGNFQLAMSVGLKLYLADALVGTYGAAYIFLLYVLQAGLMTVAGVVPLYQMRLRLRDLL